MPRRARQLSSSSVYHVMLRGVNREAIFLQEADLEHFVEVMAAVRQASGCAVLAYCLMPNHVHLVAQTTIEPIGLVMKRLGVRYAGWFNRKYDRVGHLFQDRFKSLPVEDDCYLVTLLRYVWNNPVSAGLAERPEDYAWSSRRFLTRPVPWVDNSQLRRLIPSWTLEELTAADAGPLHDLESNPPTLSVADLDQLMHDACPALDRMDFALLERVDQDRVIAALLAHGGSIRQIAAATGLSRSTIHRRQAGGLVVNP